MGAIHHADHGWVTPAVSYFVACLGSFVALRSARWALISTGRTRAVWLLFASTSLGAGIWSMHFIAMLGFSVTGVEISYQPGLTVLSLLVAVAVVGVGLFTVGYWRRRPVLALLAGGLTTGLGVAAMHYLGMAAMVLPGHLGYDHVTVALSVGIAVFAATAALWAALNIRGTLAVLAAAPVMGVAVCAMHYTGMAALSVRLDLSHSTAGGVMALQFIFPLGVGLGCYVFFGSLAFAVSPSRPDSQPLLAGPAAPLPPRAPRVPEQRQRRQGQAQRRPRLDEAGARR
ncbi:NO-binding membrane sensor protein with MHYT domain [Streptomyces sp. 1114.5]|uniref:MHYT domain-containing protein n=1 Tax=unclassified Streptomyces TaxID=2593676 RepID=UPI000BDAD7B4|nr:MULTISPECIES: MHYT domain-containing protein [unclassified Streptomyces]RKT16382.1 NO-binding membrane sensor protein with MHYT domain [Streptomyces sp. 1114.5]SOB82552.1 MHYT domain-containing protein, NO-binding membrane sensor [Streptomyces sp. 1331.2]